MNKEILRLAVPNIITNITVPLLAMADTAIAGHLPFFIYIGAVSAAGVIFNFLYWNFSFLRMGTSGFTAQAVGANNEKECVNTLVRALVTAFSAGVILIVLQSFIFKSAFFFLQASPQTRVFAAEYFFIYIWSAPFALAMFAFTGWFIGMQNAKAPMIISISANIVNIICSLIFVFAFHLDIKGIALGSLAAQIFAFVLSAFIWFKFYGKLKKHVSFKVLKSLSGFAAFFKVNRDIFLRSFALIMVTVFFTSVSARSGDIYLSANNLLMQFFILFSYIMDGFAFAAEALSGKYFGAGDYGKLKFIIRRIFAWGILLSLLFTAVYAVFAGGILGLLTDKSEVVSAALKYKYWAVLVPLAGFAAFLWDGIFVGITASRQMRDAMLFAAAGFFGLYFLLASKLGNNALWLSFLLYLTLRGLAEWILYRSIQKSFKTPPAEK